MVCGSKACVNYVKSYADLKFSDKTFAGYCISNIACISKYRMDIEFSTKLQIPATV